MDQPRKDKSSFEVGPSSAFVPWIPPSLQHNLTAAAASPSLRGFQLLERFSVSAGNTKTLPRNSNNKLDNGACLSTVSAESSCEPDEGPSEQQGTSALLHKVHSRLAQNRESVRRSRQRKKAYLHKLEGEIVTLRENGTKSEKLKPVTNPEPPLNIASACQLLTAAPSTSPQQTVTSLIRLARWRMDHCGLLDVLIKAVLSNTPEDQLRMLVTHCLKSLQQETELRRDILAGGGLYLLMAGEHVQPCERLVMWLGGWRPTDLLKLCIQMLANEGLVDEQKKRMLQLHEDLFMQEVALAKACDLLHRTVSSEIVSNAKFGQTLTEAVNSSSTAKLQPQVDSMRILMLHADEIRNKMWDDLKHTLTLRQFAVSLTTPEEMFQRVSSVYEAPIPPSRTIST